MTWLAKFLASALGPYVVGALVALLALSAGAAGLEAARLRHAKADLAAAREAAASWKAAFGHEAERALGWSKSYRQAEDLRRQERASAVAAVTETQRACDVRVSRARASAVAIQSILTKEPSRDPNGCPIRQLVDPDRLRDALRPAG